MLVPLDNSPIRSNDGGLKKVAILGSTGSIGTSTLDIIRAYPDKFEVFCLVAQKSWEKLAKQLNEFCPKYAVLTCEDSYKKLKEVLHRDCKTKLLFGNSEIDSIVAESEVDIVVAAIVGTAGLESTISAVKAGKSIALANKESIVVAGSFLQELQKESNSIIIPVDSEHSALYQSLIGNRIEDVKKLILTASGGPFYDYSPEEVVKATPEMAVKHPKWNMGAKISVDSATLVNKALEYIEAVKLFGVATEQVDVVIHRKSICHSLIEYFDGSLITQLSVPDMKGAIGFALNFPNGRLHNLMSPLNIQGGLSLEFEELDHVKFPVIRLAKECVERGDYWTLLFNEANEIAVAEFLDRKIGFLTIQKFLLDVLNEFESYKFNSLKELILTKNEVRIQLLEMIKKYRIL